MTMAKVPHDLPHFATGGSGQCRYCFRSADHPVHIWPDDYARRDWSIAATQRLARDRRREIEAEREG